MKNLALSLLIATAALPAMDVVAMPGQSPLIQFRIVFRAGSVNDPKGKEGTAALMASMLTGGGTKRMTYKELLDSMYPMAARFGDETDKEMIVFRGATHVENLEAYYSLIREMLLEPGWREDDLKRVRDDVDAVKKLYEKKGFSEAKIDSQLDVNPSTNQATLVVLIDEGSKVRIKQILVDGNASKIGRAHV